MVPALFAALTLAAGGVDFKEQVLATDLRGGYQVTAVDVNGDGRKDLIALASGMPELYWFEAPSWKRHLLVSGLQRMINLGAADTDGDGIPEIVIAHEFNNDPAKSIGIVSLLTHDGDPTKPWKAREIDRLSTSHRIRAAHIDGKVIFVNAPLADANAKVSEDYRGHVPLVFYRAGDWKREVISTEDEGVVHGLWVGKWKKGDKSDSVLTSSFLGIFRHEYIGGGKWKRTKLTAGDPSPWPRSGSSEIAPGEGWYASLEPWHGNQVVVYKGGKRDVIETKLVDGHVLLTADFDGDKKSEIVAGYRGAGRSVYLYTQDAKTGTWMRQIVDNGGISAAGCAIADLTGDGRPDLACIGSATTNLKLYENLGRHSNAGGR